ncbi:hypothetical protein, partial [Tardiphaga sp.]|uniref:hypothetical protein n=1 Tax=Tardiphaga sp. TaxID=1926292 RepID=UPI0037DA67E8
LILRFAIRPVKRKINHWWNIRFVACSAKDARDRACTTNLFYAASLSSKPPSLLGKNGCADVIS